MSVLAYDEPYRLPAGLLAFAVHAMFFALLYFGVSWQAQPVTAMKVELWQDLPQEAAPPPPMPAAPPAAPKIEKVEPPPPPPKVAEPDIALPSKKKPEPKIKPQPKPVPRKSKAAVDPELLREQAKVAELAAREQADAARAQADQAAKEANAKAAQEASTSRVVDEYKAKIMEKIRRNVVMPANVPDDAKAYFSVTLLPGGTVLKAELTKSSGNALYDDAVQRAILKSDPLPLPPDASLFSRFRELSLVFKPGDQ